MGFVECIKKIVSALALYPGYKEEIERAERQEKEKALELERRSLISEEEERLASLFPELDSLPVHIILFAHHPKDTNNYRKLHGQPMKRYVQIRKAKSMMRRKK